MYDTIDIEYVKEQAEYIGKTNIQWNTWNTAIKFWDQISDAGLSPVILREPMTGRIVVTSEQYISGRLN